MDQEDEDYPNRIINLLDTDMEQEKMNATTTTLSSSKPEYYPVKDSGYLLHLENVIKVCIGDHDFEKKNLSEEKEKKQDELNNKNIIGSIIDDYQNNGTIERTFTTYIDNQNNNNSKNEVSHYDDSTEIRDQEKNKKWRDYSKQCRFGRFRELFTDHEIDMATSFLPPCSSPFLSHEARSLYTRLLQRKSNYFRVDSSPSGLLTYKGETKGNQMAVLQEILHELEKAGYIENLEPPNIKMSQEAKKNFVMAIRECLTVSEMKILCRKLNVAFTKNMNNCSSWNDKKNNKMNNNFNGNGKNESSGKNFHNNYNNNVSKQDLLNSLEKLLNFRRTLFNTVPPIYNEIQNLIIEKNFSTMNIEIKYLENKNDSKEKEMKLLKEEIKRICNYFIIKLNLKTRRLFQRMLRLAYITSQPEMPVTAIFTPVQSPGLLASFGKLHFYPYQLSLETYFFNNNPNEFRIWEASMELFWSFTVLLENKNESLKSLKYKNTTGIYTYLQQAMENDQDENKEEVIDGDKMKIKSNKNANMMETNPRQSLRRTSSSSSSSSRGSNETIMNGMKKENNIEQFSFINQSMHEMEFLIHNDNIPVLREENSLDTLLQEIGWFAYQCLIQFLKVYPTNRIRNKVYEKDEMLKKWFDMCQNLTKNNNLSEETDQILKPISLTKTCLLTPDHLKNNMNINMNSEIQMPLPLISSNNNLVPEYLLQFDAGAILTSIVWSSIEFFEKNKNYETAIEILTTLLSTFYWTRRRGKWYDRLSIDLLHLGKKEEALEVCIQALLEEEVGGGARITMMKRCQRVYYQLKNEKQKIEKA